MLEPIIRLIHFLKEGKKNKASFFLLYCWLELFCAIFGGRVYLRHLDLIPPLSSLNPFPDEIETEKEGRQKKIDSWLKIKRVAVPTREFLVIKIGLDVGWLLSPNYERNRADSFLIVRCRHHVSKHLALDNSQPFVFFILPPLFLFLKLCSRFSNIGRGWNRYCKSLRFNHAEPELLYWWLYSAATSGWASKHQDAGTGWIWSRHLTITSSSDLIFSSDIEEVIDRPTKDFQIFSRQRKYDEE